jgi:hypothetical protein
VRLISQGVDEFWKAVHEGVAALRSGEELEFGENRIVVVEVSPERLVIRMLGQNHRFQIKDMRMGLARLMAERWFDLSAPSSKVFIGCFLFVEPNGDKAEVRGLWQEASAGGVGVEALTRILDNDPRESGEDGDE